MSFKKKKNSDKLDNFVKSDKFFHRLIGATFGFVFLIAIIGYFLMQQYENAILKVYSEQQDNYVQLVVDQINVQPDRTDAEIITEIIDTLDSGASRFWTLSKNETLLFVKNVTETNLYQGVRTEEFYESDSANLFLETLTLNRVKHDIIIMENIRYVASGVLFEYMGELYRICLLTNETVILDNNEFLSAKIDMFIYVFGLVLLILIVVLATENMVYQRQIHILKLNERIRNLNLRLQDQERELEFVNFYDSRWNLFNMNLLGKFLKKFDDKGIKSAVYVELLFASKSERKDFLNQTEFLLDERVMRFDKSETELVLIFTGIGDPTARRLLREIGVEEDIIQVVDAVDFDYNGALFVQLQKYIPEEHNV